MSSHQRSTNERVLARHRFKRSRDVLGVRGVDQTVSLTPDVASSPPSSTPITIAPSVTLLPPIGTAKLPQSSLSSSHLVLPPTTLSTSTLSSSSSFSSTPSALPSSSSSTSVQVTSSPGSMPTSSHIYSSGTPSQTDAATSPSPTKTQSLSPGAIGGIVAAIAILTLVIFGFFARRRAQHLRTMKRHTWSAGLVPALESKRNTVYAGQSSAGQSMTPSGDVPALAHLDNIPKTPAMMQSLPSPNIPGVTAPASSYNPGSPVSPIVPTSLRGAPSLRSVAPSSHSNSYAASELAIVARTFIPSLPDELHIANGEQIRILNVFDDGWALCSNSRGDQGVVPLECLQRSTSLSTEMQLQPQNELGGSGSNRTSKRMSSLTPNMIGTY